VFQRDIAHDHLKLQMTFHKLIDCLSKASVFVVQVCCPFPLAWRDATPLAAITALCVAGSDLGNIRGFPSGGCAPVMAGLDPAIHTAPLKESGHRRDLATSKGSIRATSFCSFIASKQWMGRVKPGHDTFFCRAPSAQQPTL
jgi:hypothetical protein